MSKQDDPDLDGAYTLKTPEDNKQYYRRWADRYDDDLRGDYGYVYPERIAAVMNDLTVDGPVLDIGCGTGLVGEALTARPVDGLDISPEMLARAKAKGVYRRLIEADLTKTVPISDNAYGGLISAGTFTEGHVGPEALPELVRIAAPGARFVLGVNQRVFDRLNFAGALEALTSQGKITSPAYLSGEMFAADAKHEEAGRPFTAAVFERKQN